MPSNSAPVLVEKLHDSLFDFIDNSFDVYAHLNGTDTSNTRNDEPAWINQLALKIHFWTKQAKSAQDAAGDIEPDIGRKIKRSISDALKALEEIRRFLPPDKMWREVPPNFGDLLNEALPRANAQRWMESVGKLYGNLEIVRTNHPALNVIVERVSHSRSWKFHCTIMQRVEEFGLSAKYKSRLLREKTAEYKLQKADLENKYRDAKATQRFVLQSIELYQENLQFIVKSPFEVDGIPRYPLTNIRKALVAIRTDSLDLDPTSSPPYPPDGASGLVSPFIALEYLSELKRYCQQPRKTDARIAVETEQKITVAEIVKSYNIGRSAVTRFCNANAAEVPGIKMIANSWTMTTDAIKKAKWKRRVPGSTNPRPKELPRPTTSTVKCDKCGDTSHTKRHMSPCDCGGFYKRSAN